MPCTMAPGNERNKTNMAGVLLSGALAEVDLIGDKELRSDDEEENDAGENIGERLIQTERCGDLALRRG